MVQKKGSEIGENNDTSNVLYQIFYLSLSSITNLSAVISLIELQLAHSELPTNKIISLCHSFPLVCSILLVSCKIARVPVRCSNYILRVYILMM